MHLTLSRSMATTLTLSHGNGNRHYLRWTVLASRRHHQVSACASRKDAVRSWLALTRPGDLESIEERTCWSCRKSGKTRKVSRCRQRIVSIGKWRPSSLSEEREAFSISLTMGNRKGLPCSTSCRPMKISASNRRSVIWPEEAV